MLRALRRWWRYIGARLGMALDEAADPKVLLEQAIQDARDQHRLLTESAANVIANQIQLQMRLDQSMEEYGKANALARQALVLADQEEKKGNLDKAASLATSAELFADRIVLLEREVTDLQRLLLEATAASDRAREAVRLNAANLRRKLSEREQLLSQLDQAKMQEQLNSAMAQLDEGVGDDVPTLDEVRDKIRHRLAAAEAMTEIRGSSVNIKVLEVEQVLRETESQARLAEMRTQLGLGSPQIAGQLESTTRSATSEGAAAEVD